jgi:hexokinase
MGNSITSGHKDQVSLDAIINDLTFTEDELDLIHRGFMDEMTKGWESGKGKGASQEQSSLKMISSHINILPRGDEEGVFFAVDLGGTNLRVLRVSLTRDAPIIREYREAIPARVISSEAKAEDLFDFIAKACSNLTNELVDDTAPIPLGFTFSFAVTQTSIRTGNLIEWTKGFATKGCIGNDPARLLQEALDRQGLPLVVDALCNDTVGTLMANAYKKKSKDCRIGVILGTGTNAAYSDPLLDNLIINVEWGGFDKLPRRTEFDLEVDRASGNPNRQVLEKLVSGLYLGEIVRLASLKALSGKSYVPSFLWTEDSIQTADISHLLTRDENYISKSVLSSLDPSSLEVVSAISEAVLERSAAVAAAVLAGVISRATKGMEKIRCEVGIDGSLFTKGHEYKQRLLRNLSRFYPEEEIILDFSEDGSGMGAALVAAAISRGRQVSSSL